MLCKFPFSAFMLITLLLATTIAHGQSVDWQHDVEQAKLKANQDGKLVLFALLCRLVCTLPTARQFRV